MRYPALLLILYAIGTSASAQTREDLLNRLPENAVFRHLVHHDGVRNPALQSLKRVAGADGMLTRAEVEQRKADAIAARVKRKQSVIAEMDFDGDGALLANDVERLNRHANKAYRNQLALLIGQGADSDRNGEITSRELADWAERAARDDKRVNESSGEAILLTYDLDGDARVDAPEIDEFFRILWEGYHGPPEAPLCDLPVIEADRLFVYAAASAGSDTSEPVTIPTRFRQNTHAVVAVLSDSPQDVHIEHPDSGRITVIVPDGIRDVSGVAPSSVISVAGTECLTPADTGDNRGHDIRRGQIAHATQVKDTELILLGD